MHPPRTYIVDLTHFLAADGAIGPQHGPARRFADYLTKIVVVATSPVTLSEKLAVVRCRRRPGRKPCVGKIDVDLEPETEQIVWWCPACGEQGTISNWKDSLWDCSDTARSH